jgi:D-3-phosphoglycerate dehydrogenase
MPKVLVSDPISDEGLDRLNDAGYVVDIETELSEDELVERIGGYDAIVVRSGTEMNERVVEAADSLKIIGRAGVGVDNIDIEAATRHGIIVANAPQGNTVAAAEHAVALLFSLSRNIPQANASLKKGEWRKSDFVGVEAKGKTLGVFGLGRIGGEVAKRADSLGMNVVAYDPFVSQNRADELGAELAEFDEVLEGADFVSVHTPLTDDTRHMISDEEFEAMDDDVRLVHASRGGVVDEEAAARAVEEGEIAGAAFDVFGEEPPAEGNPLLGVDDIVVTPHLGASTESAQLNVAETIAVQVIEVLEGGVAETALNAPSIAEDDLQPYLELAETLGRLVVQIGESNVDEIEVEYAGDIADEGVEPLTVAVQKGFLEPILDDPVNYVNAPTMTEDRGVRVTESKTGHTEDFVSLITVRTRDGEQHEVAGTLFGRTDPTIVLVDGYRVDAPPYGHALIVHNVDKPGMIGRVGSLLGEHDINIAGMHNGREGVGGEAIMVLNVDDEVPKDVRDELTEVEGIVSAKYVSL